MRSNISNQEITSLNNLHEALQQCPIPENEFLSNIGLFIDRRTLSRIFFMHHIYQMIIPIHGILVEFGVRWGQNLAIFSSLRAMYEPYNYTRKILGFDTFEGYPSISEKNGNDPILKTGNYGVTHDYKNYLDSLLSYHESANPLNHIKKYELIQGDVIETLPQYLSEHPETIIACAFFDLDLYEPTKHSLSLIQDYVTKGSVIAFDELGCDWFPGETLALKESFGLTRFSIRRFPQNNWPSYIVIE